jgi:FHS family L-fucose permease-like MFS transporter
VAAHASTPASSIVSLSKSRSGLFVTADGKNLFFTFALVSSLFLLWGFCNGMIDVMDKHFQEELHLNLSQSAWVQFAHYLGYFLMSLPAGWLATRLGYKGGIIAGLLLVAFGGFWFIPATHIASFWAFLLGVCLIASGLTFLETVANPYTTVLGDQRFAATRINLAQSCNGIGIILGPFVGGLFFYSRNAAGENTGSQTLYIPYFGVAVVVLILAVVFRYSDLPDIKVEDDYHLDDPTPATSHSVWTRPHFVAAVAAQFFYVAAQAGIFSFFINYMTSQTPPVSGSLMGWLPGGWFEMKGGLRLLSNQGGASLASIGSGLFLLGRFTGAGLLKNFAAHRVLGVYAAANVVLAALVFCKLGWVSAACVFLIYFFMSIMFPTIFSLGIFGLGAQAKQASAFIVMAIMGGAILPKLMGYVADRSDISHGFIIPSFCFAFVAAYAFAWPRLARSEGMRGVDTRHMH